MIQIVTEPIVLYCQIFEKSRFSGSLTSYQAEHNVILYSRFIYPRYCRQHMHFHHTGCILVLFSSKKSWQQILNTWNTVPYQTLQIISDRMIFIFIGNNIYCRFYYSFACNLIVFFQIHFQVIIICIRLRKAAVSSFPRYFFYNIYPSGKLISPDCFFQHRIILQYRHTISDCLSGSTFIRMNQHFINILDCKHFLVHNTL